MRRQFIKKEKDRSTESGFTMMEILIALAIFSFGILGVGLLQEQAAFSNIFSGNIAANVALSVDRLEKLMSLDYDDPALSTDARLNPHTLEQSADWVDNDGDGQIDEDDESGNIFVSWNVVETNPKIGSDLYSFKTVTVTINRDGLGGSDFVTLQRNIPNIVGD